MTSYWSSVATVTQSCIVSEITLLSSTTENVYGFLTVRSCVHRVTNSYGRIWIKFSRLICYRTFTKCYISSIPLIRKGHSKGGGAIFGPLYIRTYVWAIARKFITVTHPGERKVCCRTTEKNGKFSGGLLPTASRWRRMCAVMSALIVKLCALNVSVRKRQL